MSGAFLLAKAVVKTNNYQGWFDGYTGARGPPPCWGLVLAWTQSDLAMIALKFEGMPQNAAFGE